MVINVTEFYATQAQKKNKKMHVQIATTTTNSQKFGES